MAHILEAARKVRNVYDKLRFGEVKRHPYFPVVRWNMDPKLQRVFSENQGKIAVGSIVGAGHMPVTISPEILEKVGYKGDGNLTPAQIGQIKTLRTNPDGSPKQIRFLDTNGNNAAQKAAVKNQLEAIFLEARKNGAERVLFSVCSISAGFDINYIESLAELMNKYGAGYFILSLFTPFNMDSVRNYSLKQGLGQEKWIDRFKAVINNQSYQNSIFIHEASLVPYFRGDRRKGPPSHEEAEQRGRIINGDENSVYWDVNEMMVDQAIEAVGGDIVKIYGVFAEAFMDSTSAVGGGPQIMARLEHERRKQKSLRGATIINITDGLTDIREVEDLGAEIAQKYEATYKDIYSWQDRNLLLQLALKGRRRYLHKQIAQIPPALVTMS